MRNVHDEAERIRMSYRESAGENYSLREECLKAADYLDEYDLARKSGIIQMLPNGNYIWTAYVVFLTL